MSDIEIKKINEQSAETGAETSTETHKRTMDLEELLGVKSTTFYKDMEFLNIKAIKDENNIAWISNKDFERIRLLRKHVKETGRRAGFSDLKEGKLVTVKEEGITNNKKGEISNQDIYVTPEDPKENMDVDNIVRQGAELKAREIAMPHLVVRAIADKLDESELPEDLQEKSKILLVDY